jgi:FkbM family methyltransferase
MLKRTVIAALQPLVADRVYTVRHGLAKGLKRRGGLGFVPQWGALPLEEQFLQTLELDGDTVYDVGGYQGVFTLFFARQVGPSGRVLTFEPNPASVATIRENVALNGFTNVRVHQLALGAAPGRGTLVFPTDESARGSLNGDIQDQIRTEPQARSLEVEIDSLDHQVALGLPPPSFVKLDVEGLERAVLGGMSATLAEHHPRLYIEIHGADATRKLENASQVIEFLWKCRYSIYHVENRLDIERSDHIARAIEGHIYCC